MSSKVLILVNSGWNAYNFRKGLIQHLLENDFQVQVASPVDEYIDQLKEWGVIHHMTDLEGSGMNPFKDLAYARRLKLLKKEIDPSVILSFTIKPNIYGSMIAGKTPIICNVSGLGTTFLWKGWVQKGAEFMYRRAFRRADFIFFQNADDRALFLSRIPISQAKTGLLPGSGIDPNEFNAEPPHFDRPTVFLMIGRLIVEKGVREYLEAAKIVKSKYPNVIFRLAGTYEPGHKRSIDLETWNQIQDGPIQYLGHISPIYSAIEDADVIILPSYREGTPRTLLEAGAMSRPLIATDVPGCREVVSDGLNGFLCKVEKAENLSRKIQLFLSLSQTEKMQMARESRKLVETKFNEKIVFGEYDRKISQLLTS